MHPAELACDFYPAPPPLVTPPPLTPPPLTLLPPPLPHAPPLINVLGALYATTLFFSIINATVIQPVISAERAVSYRERAAGMYSVLPWTLALVSALYPTCLNISYMLYLLNSLVALSLVHKFSKNLASGRVVSDRLHCF